jgi:hypothetical protein
MFVILGKEYLFSSYFLLQRPNFWLEPPVKIVPGTGSSEPSYDSSQEEAQRA